MNPSLIPAHGPLGETSAAKPSTSVPVTADGDLVGESFAEIVIPETVAKQIVEQLPRDVVIRAVVPRPVELATDHVIDLEDPMPVRVSVDMDDESVSMTPPEGEKDLPEPEIELHVKDPADTDFASVSAVPNATVPNATVPIEEVEVSDTRTPLRPHAVVAQPETVVPDIAEHLPVTDKPVEPARANLDVQVSDRATSADPAVELVARIETVDVDTKKAAETQPPVTRQFTAPEVLGGRGPDVLIPGAFAQDRPAKTEQPVWRPVSEGAPDLPQISGKLRDQVKQEPFAVAEPKQTTVPSDVSRQLPAPEPKFALAKDVIVDGEAQNDPTRMGIEIADVAQAKSMDRMTYSVLTQTFAAQPPVNLPFIRSDGGKVIADVSSIALETLQTIAGPEQISPSRSAAAPIATPAPTHLGHQVSIQVAQAVSDANSKKFELRLEPEELGKVRILLAPREAGMAITIIAERPETLEILRRNADQLASDLTDLGYEHSEFNFGEDDAPGDKDAQNQAAQWGPEEELTLQIPVQNMQSSGPVTGLDLKF